MTLSTAARRRSIDYRRAQQYVALQTALDHNYGPWIVTSPPRSECHIHVIRQTAGRFQMVDCVSAPCAANSQRLSTTPDTLTVQLMLAGRERFGIDDQRLLLVPGDVLLWDSTRSMRFEVLERMHKVSVTMPLTRLRCWLPRSWRRLAGRLPAGSQAASVLSSFVHSVSPRFLSSEPYNGDALTEAVIATLVGVLGVDEGRADDSPREASLLRVKHYIERSLDDPSLSPAGIARANGISLRTLHGLFESEGTTVLQYVIQCRLLRCQRELANPSMSGRNITDIALACGFMSPNHFSRRFKDAFGLTPREYRHQACATH